MPRVPTVVIDVSALGDSRRAAGIGRYVAGLVAELECLETVRVLPCRPRRAARPDTWALRTLTAQPALLRMALRERASLVHATSSDPGAWTAGRQVVTLHDTMPWTSAGWGRMTSAWFSIQRLRLARVAAVIAVSDDTAAGAIHHLGISPQRVTVVPEGVGAPFGPGDADGDLRRRARAGVPDQYLLWTGTLAALDHRKGLDLLCDALAGLKQAGTKLPPLVCAGRTGAASEWLARRAASAQLQVLFTGFVDDSTLASLYRGAAAVVVPSRHEGFGLPLLEAMACGAAVVTTRGGNLAALAGEGALVVDVDAAALGAGLRAILDNQARASALRVAARTRAAAFSWRLAAERTAEVYLATLARG